MIGLLSRTLVSPLEADVAAPTFKTTTRATMTSTGRPRRPNRSEARGGRSRTSVLNRFTDWRRRCALFRSSARADPCQAPAIMDGGCGLLSKQRSSSTLAHSRIFPSVRGRFSLLWENWGFESQKSFLTRAGANNRYNASGENF